MKEAEPKSNKQHDGDENEHDKRNSEKAKDPQMETSSKLKRQKRKEERKRLMELVPLKDEHSISYTKQQLRRMRKRVARGLAPVETEEEKRDRLREDSLLRKQEEAELQGMVYQKDGTTKHEDDSDVEEEEEKDRGEKGSDSHEEQDTKYQPKERQEQQQSTGTGRRDDTTEMTESETSPSKKTRRSKPVPNDYICQACKNKETPPLHWIYDCPLKVTMRGINHKKSRKHVHDPSSLKVFVSGLPFDAKVKDVRQLFAHCGNVKKCKLLTFSDTERCKGQAYLTFETSEAAVEALKLNGSPIGGDEEGKDGGGNKRRNLTLKVSKMLSRAVTKKKGGNASYNK